MKKPAHQHIRDWRVVQIGVTIYLCHILGVMVTWMVATPYGELKDWHLAPITASIPALIGGLFAIVNTIMKRNEKEDHDV